MNNTVKNRFLTSIEQGRVPHACFIACVDTHESYTLARQAAALFCTGSTETENLGSCPDFFELDENSYSSDNVRDVLKALAKQGYSDKHGRTVLLKNAHAMNETAQNALLKTLEEPPLKTLFILTGNEAGLLPTIRSRCSMIRLGLTPRTQVVNALCKAGATEKEAILYTSLGEGLYERALRLFTDEKFKALRDDSINTLIAFLQGKLPFESLKALSQNKSAQEAVTFTLSFMRDILLYKLDENISCNVDKLSDIAAFAHSFTIGKINSIIDIMTDAKSRLTSSAVQAPVVDRMFTKISEEI